MRKQNFRTDVHKRNKLQTTWETWDRSTYGNVDEKQLGLTYKKWGQSYILKCGWRNPGDWNKELFMIAMLNMCILRRRCSSVYNVVTAQCIVSIILNIQ